MAVLDLAAPTLARVRHGLGAWTVDERWRTPSVLGGPLLVSGSVVVLEFLRARGLHLPDPLAALLLPVVAGAALGGIRSGILGAFVAVIYSAVILAGVPFMAQPGNALRVLGIVVALPIAAVLVGLLRDRAAVERRELLRRRETTIRLAESRSVIERATPEALARTVCDEAARLVDADLVALSVADRHDGRHAVRGVRGSGDTSVGVEILPGVGVAGQAIRDRRTLLRSSPDGRSTVVAVPFLVDDRVVATLMLARTGDPRPFEPLQIETLESLAGIAAHVLLSSELQSELAESALRDPLTGLYNRSYLDAALDQLLAFRRRVAPSRRKPMAVVIFDIDGFRAFNERHGRTTGDRVLQAIGGVLRRRFRQSDLLARVGGDGYLVVLDGADRDTVARVAGQVRASVRELELTSERGEPVRVSVSAGCATFDEADPGAQALIRTAEAALDTARWSGKDAIVSI